APRARVLGPFYEREVFGRTVMVFEGRPASELAALGDIRTPSIADLFVAKMQSSQRGGAGPDDTPPPPGRKAASAPLDERMAGKTP
ncbi:MAG: hypothetical protein ACREU3_19560, partial [Steroidobacteraceae bacterium]